MTQAELKQQEIKSDLDKLIYIMKNSEIIEALNQLPKVLTEDWIEQAMEKLDKSNMSPDQRMHYEMMMARNASIIEMRKEEEKQRKKEEEQRIAELAKEAKKRGEKRAALDMGKKLKDLGVKTEIIIQATGLTQEEVEQL